MQRNTREPVFEGVSIKLPLNPPVGKVSRGPFRKRACDRHDGVTVPLEDRTIV
jgi:hypothetical protein